MRGGRCSQPSSNIPAIRPYVVEAVDNQGASYDSGHRVVNTKDRADSTNQLQGYSPALQEAFARAYQDPRCKYRGGHHLDRNQHSGSKEIPSNPY